MSTVRTRLTIIAATATVVAATTVGLTPTAAGAAPQVACSATRVSSFTFGTHLKTYSYYTVTSSSGEPPQNIDFHTFRSRHSDTFVVGVTACKNTRTHKWQALSTTSSEIHDDLTLTVKGRHVTVTPTHPGNFGGDGAFISRVTSTHVEGYATTCQSKPRSLSVLGVIHGLLGLPIPKVNFAYTVAAYIADKAIPDAKSGSAYRCGRLTGEMDLPWHFSSTGKAEVKVHNGGFVGVSNFKPQNEYCVGDQSGYSSCTNTVVTQVTYS